MPRYLLSVFAPADAGPNGPYASHDEMVQALADTDAFNAMLRRDGHLVFADGLAPTASACVVDGRAGRAVLTEGPYLESTEHLGGFWIIEAADRDEALRLATLGSRACRGTVEVRPFAAAPATDSAVDRAVDPTA